MVFIKRKVFFVQKARGKEGWPFKICTTAWSPECCFIFWSLLSQGSKKNVFSDNPNTAHYFSYCPSRKTCSYNHDVIIWESWQKLPLALIPFLYNWRSATIPAHEEEECCKNVNLSATKIWHSVLRSKIMINECVFLLEYSLSCKHSYCCC